MVCDETVNRNTQLTVDTEIANFTPYTYGGLVAASTSITQHIAVIFNFLAIFVRLKERLVDPRVVIWITVFAFLLGYLVWETLVYHSIQESSRYASR